MNQDIKYRILGLPIFTKTVSNVSEKRSANYPQSDLKNPAEWLTNMFGFQSGSGVVVNEQAALTLSAVWGCVKVLSETLAMLPLNVFAVDASGNRNIDNNNPLQYLLHKKPNGLMTSFTFRETMQLHKILTGNGYAVIHRDALGNVGELELIVNPGQVFVARSKMDGQKYYSYQGKVYADYEILHMSGISMDGLKGVSPIQYARENFGTGISLQNFGGTFFKNGARMSGVLETTGTLDDKAYERLKNSWQQNYGGPENVGKTSILENGTKYTPISLSNEDAQYLLSRKFSIEEIARIFRVPLHMIGSLDHATNNNIEHQGIEFVTHTMTPHVVRWEQELDSKLIPVKDRGNKYIKFNMNGLLRGDSAARAAFHKEMFYAGAITPNEIRKYEDMNQRPEGNETYIPVNMLPTAMAGKNITTKIENKEI
jgi:HK97 family phage portal protein